jgi:PAS domain S-box-containing protein
VSGVEEFVVTFTDRLKALQHWSNRSLANAFSLRAAQIAVASGVAVALIFLAVLYWVEAADFRQRLHGRATRAAERVEGSIGVVDRSAADLAKNPMFMTAVLDSRGRDTYVAPFLENYRFPIAAASALALCDINGARLAGTRSPLSDCRANSPLFKQVVQDGRIRRDLVPLRDGHTAWTVYQAVVFTYTGTVEGVVVTQIDLHDVLRNIPDELNLDAVALVRAGSSETLAAVKVERTATSSPTTAKALLFGGTPGAVPFPIEAVVEDVFSPFEHKLIPLALGYGIGMSLLVLLVVYAARRVSQKMIAPLEDALRASEAHARTTATMLRLMCDNVPDMMWAKDLDRRYIFANRALCDQLLNAADTEEPLGKTDMFFARRERDSHPEDPHWHTLGDLCEDSDAITLKHGKPSVYEESGNVRGSFVCFDVHKAPFVNENGEVIGTVGSARDVTERKAAELALRKLSLAVEQSPESIAITNTNAELEYVNEAFVRTTGYSREEAIGQNPRILHSGKTPRETYDDLWQTLTQGRSWKGEFHNKRKDGSDYIELAIITPLRQADGSISHYVGVKQDITRQKQIGLELDAHRHHLEELVAQRTKELVAARDAAEAASRAKSEFLSNMSHELRTPMNGIMGMTDLVLRRATDPQQIDWLNKSRDSAQRLLAIINDILDLSSIDAGQMQLEGTDFFLGSILDDVAVKISPAARDKGLCIVVEGDALPLWLHGDALRLRQALFNFAGNAVKFTEAGSITLRALRLHEEDGRILLRFEVTDTGVGIAPEALRRLFTPFEQADSSLTRKFGGTGLGLAITRRLAKLMDGEVGADSTPGTGSTFWFAVRLRRGHRTLPNGLTRNTEMAVPGEVAQEAEEDSSASVAADLIRTRTVLEQMEPLLASDDTQAGDLFEEHRLALIATLGAAAIQLERQVAAFDYPGALATLREILLDIPRTDD